MNIKFMMMALAAMMWLSHAHGQELFVYSEPASNMPAHSVGIRISNSLMNETGAGTGRINFHTIPEIMWGVNKNLMIHAEGFISNRNKSLSAEGAALYAKYRFLSKDGMYRHFRMAAFGRVSTNNATVHQQEIETNGHNSGYELGLISTQLLHKTALSLTVAYEQATNNAGNNEYPVYQPNKAVNYSFSTGHLFLPKKYTSYKQTNLNAMVEVIGQYHPEDGRQFLDIAPSLQLIFNSQTRVDIGYKFQLTSSMTRTAPEGLLIRVEHLLFNVL